MTAVDSDALVAALSRGTVASGIEHLRRVGADGAEGLARLADQVERLVHADPETADSLGRLVVQAATQGGHPALAARADYSRARIHAERGRLDRALDLIATARRRWSEAGEQAQALRTDLGRMQILDDLGRHAEAATVGEELLLALDGLDGFDELDGLDALDGDALLHGEGDGQPVLLATIRAAAWCNIGVASSFIGEHERSLEAYTTSERGYAGLGLATEVAQQQANRGIELLALGRVREAARILRSAAQTFAGAGDRLWAAKCSAHLAEALLQLGNVEETLRILVTARDEAVDLAAHAEEARILLRLGRAYLTAGLLPEAVAASTAAASRARGAGMPHDEAFAHLDAAAAHLAQGTLLLAEDHALAAGELFAQVDDRQYLARLQVTRAEIAARRGDREAAVVLLARAVDDLAAGGWRVPLAWALLRCCDQAGSTTERADVLDRAAGLVAEVGVPSLRDALGLRQARLLREQRRDEEAVTVLRRLVEAADESGADLAEPILRIAALDGRTQAHDELVDLLITRDESGDLAEAVAVGDRAKAHTLRGLAASRPLLDAPGESAATSVARRELAERRADLAAAYHAWQTTTGAGRRQVVRAEVARLEAEIGELRVRVALDRTPPQPRPDPAERAEHRDEHHDEHRDGAGAQAAPPGSRAVLAFHLVGEDVLVFVVADGIEVRRLVGAVRPVRRSLQQLTAQTNHLLLGDDLVARHLPRLEAAMNEVLRDLYDVLVAPVRPLLQGVEELVVVPDRILNRVPFHALHDGTEHLLRRWDVTVAPGVPWDEDHRQRAGVLRTGSHQALVVAVPDERSPLVTQEAAALLELMPDAAVLTGDGATVAALAGRLPGPQLVHLACHATFRPGNVLFSGLRLADGWLTSADVLDLDLDGALVTLSACESGRPTVHTAEPVGLAWAFMAAGASGVVVSQWLVDDAVTTQLMTDFYQHLVQGVTPARALRQAMLGVADHHPHPYYWAPFSYVAAPQPLTRLTRSSR